ncbi:carboxypeptidase-like regulatory domain-containing protein [bacterium]|nr:carboxypeptidase-like regulatory domain-containing protein [bacterium]
MSRTALRAGMMAIAIALAGLFMNAGACLARAETKAGKQTVHVKIRTAGGLPSFKSYEATLLRLLTPEWSAQLPKNWEKIANTWRDPKTGEVWVVRCTTRRESKFDGREPGTYRVQVVGVENNGNAPGAAGISDPVIVKEGKNPTAVVRIEDGPALTIHMTDAQSGRALERGSVVLFKENGMPVGSGGNGFRYFTDKNGTIRYPALAPGKYFVEAGGYHSKHFEFEYKKRERVQVEVKAGAENRVEIAMQEFRLSERDMEERRPWVVEGRVTDEHGNPMEGVVVDAAAGHHAMMPTGEATTGPDGHYRLHFGPGNINRADDYPEGVKLQAVAVRARKDGYYEKDNCRAGRLEMAGRLANVTGTIIDAVAPERNKEEKIVLPGKPRRVDFVLLPAAHVSGRFVDAKGNPLEGIKFSLHGMLVVREPVLKNRPATADFEDIGISGATDLKGRFDLRSVPCREFGFRIQEKKAEVQGNRLNFARPGEYRVEVVYDRSERTVDYRVLSTPEGVNAEEVLNPGEKAKTGRAKVIEHDFALNQKIETPITMGNAEWPKVLMIQSVEFTRDVFGGTIRGNLMMGRYSYPKMAWRISIELMDGNDKTIARKENTVQTSGEIIGQRLLETIHPIEFAFGGKLDVKKIKNFRVSVVDIG